MRKIIIMAFLALIFCKEAVAQEGGKERIRAYRTAYITQELDLSSEEAEKFWPVYNEFDKKLFQLKVEKIRKEKHRIKELGGPDQLSDEDAKKTLFDMLTFEKEAAVTREKMYKELSKILSPVKLMKLYVAEMNFNKKLLHEYRKRKPDN
jgi:hypothetical protein